MKISAVHITTLTLNFIFQFIKKKNLQFLGHFSMPLSLRQNKDMLWVLIFSVRTQGIICYTFSDQLNFLFRISGPAKLVGCG